MTEPAIPGAWHPPLVWPPPMIREIGQLLDWLDRTRVRVLCHPDDFERIRDNAAVHLDYQSVEVLKDEFGIVRKGHAIVYRPPVEPMPSPIPGVRPVPPVPPIDTVAPGDIRADILAAGDIVAASQAGIATCDRCGVQSLEVQTYAGCSICGPIPLCPGCRRAHTPSRNRL